MKKIPHNNMNMEDHCNFEIFYKSLPKYKIRALYNAYKLDFEMFHYDPALAIRLGRDGDHEEK